MTIPTHDNASLERRLAAIMFTDIVGYTAIMGDDNSRAMELVRKNQSIQEKIIKKFNGALLKEMGDGTLSSFKTASEAINCAKEIQATVRKDPDLKLRIGIHLGEIMAKNNDVYGDGVNVASRLESLADTGGIYISEAVEKATHGQRDIKSKYLGEFELKNVNYLVKVYAIQGDELPEPVPKVQSVTSKKTRLKTRNTIFYLIGILLVISSLTIIYWKSDDKVKVGSLRIVPMTTSTAGIQGPSTWSPDGNYFAYEEISDGNAKIKLTTVGEETGSILTNHPADELQPRWSPDGKKIAFLSDRGLGLEIYLIPPFGGAERVVTNTGLHMLEQFWESLLAFGARPWSLDSKRLLFPKLMANGSIRIWSVDTESGEENQITRSTAAGHDLHASWNENNDGILFQRNGNIYTSSLSGEEQPVLEDQHTNIFPIWNSDYSKIIFVSSQDGFLNLWMLDLASREIEQITFNNGLSLAPNISPDGALTYQEFSHKTDIVRLDLNKMQKEKLTNHIASNFHPVVSPNRKFVLYQSDRTANNEIWMLDLETGTETNLTKNQGTDIKPHWSPDGQEFVFISNRSGDYHLWKQSVGKGQAIQLTTSPILLPIALYDYAMNVKWSPSGKYVAYLANSESGRSLWRVDSNGHQEVIIETAHSFDWYLNDNMIIYNTIRKEDMQAGLHVRNIETGIEVELMAGRLTELFVKQDGTAVGYAKSMSHWSQDIFVLNLEPPDRLGEFPRIKGEPNQITEGKGMWHAHNPSWSPDGKFIYFTRDEDSGNIMQIINRKF